MRSLPDDERASVSGLFVCSVMGLISLAALTFDGGRIIDAYVDMSSTAAAAARVGGQEIDGIRQNFPRIHSRNARSAMNRYLQGRGFDVVLEVSDRRIRVSLSKRVRTRWLEIFGVGGRTVSASRSVEIVEG
jgi:hypothetical protein